MSRIFLSPNHVNEHYKISRSRVLQLIFVNEVEVKLPGAYKTIIPSQE
jgi:hypothetical protein